LVTFDDTASIPTTPWASVELGAAKEIVALAAKITALNLMKLDKLAWRQSNEPGIERAVSLMRCQADAQHMPANWKALQAIQ
jgi:hypothetical protein